MTSNVVKVNRHCGEKRQWCTNRNPTNEPACTGVTNVRGKYAEHRARCRGSLVVVDRESLFTGFLVGFESGRQIATEGEKIAI